MATKQAGTRSPDSDYLDSGLLLQTLTAVKKGNLAVRMPLDRTGVAGKVYDTLNDVIDLNEKLVAERDRVGGRHSRWV